METDAPSGWVTPSGRWSQPRHRSWIRMIVDGSRRCSVRRTRLILAAWPQRSVVRRGLCMKRMPPRTSSASARAMPRELHPATRTRSSTPFRLRSTTRVVNCSSRSRQRGPVPAASWILMMSSTSRVTPAGERCSTPTAVMSLPSGCTSISPPPAKVPKGPTTTKPTSATMS